MSREDVVRNPEEEENVAPYPRDKKHRRPGRPRSNAQLVKYFERRQKKLHVVATTTTPSGQIIDWIPRESQDPNGEIAEPPPDPARVTGDREHPERKAKFELEDPKVEHGPEGTVPVPRKRLDGLPSDRLQNFLAKHRSPVREELTAESGFSIPLPEEGGHRYAATAQTTTAFGGEGALSAFDPYTETAGDFSLIQISLSNVDLPKKQTIEAGWQECHDIYGDWLPHLFLFYTTNGYTESGDGKGGYNQDVDGWIQHDDSVHPGAVYSPTSVRGGTQRVLRIKFQLYRNNWWFRCNERWLGYYPARLFMGDKSVFETLGDHADHIKFYGEIFDSDAVAGKTKTDMTSGHWPDEGWQFTGYMHNLRVQVDREGNMDDYDGSSSVTDPDMYDLELHMRSGGSWGSYFWLGGPGAG